MALAVKADLLLSLTKSSQNPLAYMLIVCISSGFSERAFLNLIGHFDHPTLQKDKKSAR